MDIPAELIYGLVFAAILLFQYVMKRFGLLPTPDAEPRQAPLPPEPPETAEQEAPLADSPRSAQFTPAALPALPGRAAWLGAPAATETPSTAGRATLLLGNRQDLQRAVFSMTVLGPCRALERPDDR
ncbi:hypothetical protein J2X09_002664 [Hydrogenophaga laconesensis]|uniref:Uncharacterized protein n=1 Tax=Hydrogenophaga laconesensis TaxID=1805971 RepID=A0ABU1VBR3_9BURK|nr:hypothetical protein [Hydrogenophaga laconesensis]